MPILASLKLRLARYLFASKATEDVRGDCACPSTQADGYSVSIRYKKRLGKSDSDLVKIRELFTEYYKTVYIVIPLLLHYLFPC